MPNGDGFGFGFDPSAFFAGILAAIEAVINAIIAALVFLFNLLVFAANFLLNGLLTVAKYLLDGFKVLLRGLKHVLSDIFHGRFRHLFEDYLKLKETLKRWFGPLLKWLQRIRKWFDLYVLKPMRQIINLIQRIRQILVIFRIFHLKFAEKLDAFLGRVEAKLIKNVLALRAKINEIATIINLILDPAVLILHNPLFRTFLRGLDTTVHAIFGVSLLDMFPTKGGELGQLAEVGRQKDAARSVVKDSQNPRTAVGYAGKLNTEFYQMVIKDITL